MSSQYFSRKEAGTGRASITLELVSPTYIQRIEIVNAGSAFVQVRTMDLVHKMLQFNVMVSGFIQIHIVPSLNFEQHLILQY